MARYPLPVRWFLASVQAELLLEGLNFTLSSITVFDGVKKVTLTPTGNRHTPASLLPSLVVSWTAKPTKDNLLAQVIYPGTKPESRYYGMGLSPLNAHTVARDLTTSYKEGVATHKANLRQATSKTSQALGLARKCRQYGLAVKYSAKTDTFNVTLPLTEEEVTQKLNQFESARLGVSGQGLKRPVSFLVNGKQGST